jgi:type I restriction enzyme R subunit
MAAEAEHAKLALEERLSLAQSQGAAQPKGAVAAFVTAATMAASAIEINEADTRKLIDEQLRQAGWTADSAELRFSKGTRPEKGKNLAIAEWPTSSGPADYVLFVGLVPVAAVEAKRKNIDVSGALQQAKHYSRAFPCTDGLDSAGGAWGASRDTPGA